MVDRTSFVPFHGGDLVLPSTPLFNRLLRFAHEEPPRTAVRDVVAKIEATHLQLIVDILVLRKRLQRELGIEQIKPGEEVYIAILAGGGYEYAVAMLAVLAFGAAAVPLSTALPPKEALYYVLKSQAVVVLASTEAVRRAVRVEKLVKDANPKSTLVCVPIASSTLSKVQDPSSVQCSSNGHLDENAAAVVIFTSGTTGPPKGAVMRRSFVFDCALSVADHYKVRESDVLLHVLPVHHATGIGMMFFPFLVAGACIEFRSGSFDSKWTWERWREGGLTFFSGVPTIWMRMMRYYQEHLEGSPQVKEYVRGARDLRACICGTSALPSTIADFWASILGKQILLRYGGSEFGAVLKVRMGDEDVPKGSVGEVFSGIDLKLSEGEQGEVLVKSPYMFSKYLFDEQGTRKAHNEQGYYKTGDVARREGKYYWILGRESIDILKCGGYRISALDIEREIMTLDYLSECMVVGVEDAEYGQRVAAALVLKETSAFLSLCELRKDLRHRLAGYKMPTIMRIVEGELPKMVTGKVSKKMLGPRLFPPDYRSCREVQFWDSGMCYNAPESRL